MTLTLNAGALYVNVLPVVMVLVWGTTAFGAWGVLLAVSAPVRTCSVPVLETVLNWVSEKVMLCAVLPAFAIWKGWVVSYALNPFMRHLCLL